MQANKKYNVSADCHIEASADTKVYGYTHFHRDRPKETAEWQEKWNTMTREEKKADSNTRPVYMET